MYFVWGPHGRIEVDYTMADAITPRLRGRKHPRPQHWHDLRQRALRRDRHRCTACNSRQNLEVHHRTYERWGRERLSDVYTLCHACHQTFHQERRLAA